VNYGQLGVVKLFSMFSEKLYFPAKTPRTQKKDILY